MSNSRRTPDATPAASFISRATSSKNRFVVCVIVRLPGVSGSRMGARMPLCKARGIPELR